MMEQSKGMNGIKWCESMLRTKEAQHLLEEKIKLLIHSYFEGKSDYAIEKFIKSFGEGLTYLEDNLLKSRGLHPSQIQGNMLQLSMNPVSTAQKLDEVEKILKMEIKRQYRHFDTFLSEL